MAVNVSMQTPISSYGNFGSVISDSINKARQRESDENQTQWRIESQEIMQLRDLHENARQFDITHELKRDYFDLEENISLRKQAIEDDQYWNYIQDMQEISLEQADMNWENAKQVEIEQKHMQSQVVPEMNKLKTWLDDRIALRDKEYEETQDADVPWMWNDLNPFGPSDDEIKARNLKNVNLDHEAKLKLDLWKEFGIQLDDLNFDSWNTDSATMMESLTLEKLIDSNIFTGSDSGQAFVDNYHAGNLTNQTYNVINNMDMSNVMSGDASVLGLGDLMDKSYNSYKISPSEQAQIFMYTPDPRVGGGMEQKAYDYKTTMPHYYDPKYDY